MRAAGMDEEDEGAQAAMMQRGMATATRVTTIAATKRSLEVFFLSAILAPFV
jgi:hypothetical protein